MLFANEKRLTSNKLLRTIFLHSGAQLHRDAVKRQEFMQ